MGVNLALAPSYHLKTFTKPIIPNLKMKIDGSLMFFAINLHAHNTFTLWLPHLQLCVCYSQLGAYKLAYLHNEVALHFRPEDQAILNNKALLEAMVNAEE